MFRMVLVEVALFREIFACAISFVDVLISLTCSETGVVEWIGKTMQEGGMSAVVGHS